MLDTGREAGAASQRRGVELDQLTAVLTSSLPGGEQE